MGVATVALQMSQHKEVNFLFVSLQKAGWDIVRLPEMRRTLWSSRDSVFIPEVEKQRDEVAVALGRHIFSD